MKYEVRVLKLEPQPALAIRADVPRDGVGAALAQLLPRTFQRAMAEGGEPAGMPFTRYLSDHGERLTIEAGVPVRRPLRGEGDILPIELPGGPVATVTHVGPYAGLPAAHVALVAWATENGRGTRPFAWETYVTDPGSEPDSSKWETRVFLALSETT